MNARKRLDQMQQDRVWIALPAAVLRRTGEHQGSRMSSSIAFYAMFSIFPLLLVFVGVLGIALDGRPDLRANLVDSALANIPLIGQEFTSSNSAIDGNPTAVVIGLLTALWAGLGAILALESALNVVWDVRPSDRSNFVFARVRALGVLLAVLVGLTVSTGVGTLGSALQMNGVVAFGTLLVSAALNVVGLLAVFWLLTANDDRWRAHLPGAIGGGLALFALQQAGGLIARRYVNNASDTYGTFAVVIGLLVWLHLVSRAVILAAETNAVIERRLWPRSFDDDVVSDGDRRAMLLNIERVRYNDQLTTTVHPPADALVDW